MLEEDFEEDVVPEFGRENLLRVYEFIKYCKYEKEIPELPELQEIDPEFFPGLTAKPWWNVEELDNPEWVEKVVAGLPYVQGELADLLEDNEEYLISDSVKNEVMGGGWSGFRLRRLGAWLSRNCELFPKTVQLLKQSDVPLAMRGVIVARQEVRAQAGQSIPPNVEPLAALKHLLEILERSLQRCSSEELRGQLRRARRFSVPLAPSRREMKAERSELKLFDPRFGTVRGQEGLAAALAYLVAEFLALKKRNPTETPPARRSLRLAVASLAHHEAFDKEHATEKCSKRLELEKPKGANLGSRLSWTARMGPIQNFRNTAVGLLCALDAALSWSSLDPFGWIGTPEAESSLLVARGKNQGLLGLCSFEDFTHKLSLSLQSARSSQKFWTRFERHLESIRRRPLEEAWKSPWTVRESASMLVRNRTKVPLRVELHSQSHSQSGITPVSDWILLQPLFEMFFSREPLLVAKVNPGIEWALRPRRQDGQDF
ncbi:Aspartate beta-hydroxylase domain-containing protein 2 [Durusdinium trenchii]|uniref:Aspartate beta-hydroxylase domain-containing protein 2 n=1 Tax=Durusdinium trenchii TaxID=1381693 RepID=A0ABP0M5F6_9DINO